MPDEAMTINAPHVSSLLYRKRHKKKFSLFLFLLILISGQILLGLGVLVMSLFLEFAVLLLYRLLELGQNIIKISLKKVSMINVVGIVDVLISYF